MKTEYRRDIDGLRAIAVLAVVIFHAFPHALPGGFVGVDVFFVISGYLISGILFRNFDQNRFSYQDFYFRRIKRILPALIAVLGFVWMIGFFALLPGEFKILGHHLFASTLFYENLNLIHESGYFDSSSDLKPLLHLWSLSVEEQFYLIWPPIIAICYRLKLNLRKVIYILIFASLVANIQRIHIFPISTFYGIHSRFWELMFGALLAHLKIKEQHRLQHYYSGVGLALLLISIVFLGGDLVYPGAWALLPVTGSFLLILAGENAFFNRHFLSRTLLVNIGLISYPLYLWHWPLLAFLRTLSLPVILHWDQSTILILFTIATAFLLSTLTYHLLEKKIRYSALRPVWVGSILLTLFCGVGFIGKFTEEQNGFANRIPIAPQPEIAKKILECQKNIPLKTVEWCYSNHPEMPPDVVAIGDSHASSFVAGLIDHYSNRVVHAFGTGDTLGLWDTGSEIGGELTVDGLRNLNLVFEWAIKNKAKTVFLVSRGPTYLGANPFVKRTVKIRNLGNRALEDQVSIYELGLTKTLEQLQAANIETIFVYDNPEFSFNPKQVCESRPVRLFEPKGLTPCHELEKPMLDSQKIYRDVVARVLARFPKVKTLDPFSYLCDGQYCDAKRGDVLFYVDPHHLSAEGTELLTSFLPQP